MIIYYTVLRPNFCPLCCEGNDCGFTFPKLNAFNNGEIFSHIKLPLNEFRDIPTDLLSFILPKNYNQEQCYIVFPFHSIFFIKRCINTFYKND